MKKVILIIGSLLVIQQTEAQHLSIGGKTGATSWLTVGNSKDKYVSKADDGKVITFTNEIFGRYQTKGKLAFELGFSHINREMRPYGISFNNCWGSEDSVYHQYSKRYIDLIIALQYKITLPCQTKCPILNKLSHYVGILANPGIVNTYGTALFTSTGDDAYIPQPFKHTNQNWTIKIGASHTMVYALTEHFNLISTLSFRMKLNSFEYLQYYESSNAQLNWGIGAGYSF